MASFPLVNGEPAPPVKKIEAVIAPSRVDAARAALCRRGVRGELTLTKVQRGNTDKISMSASDGTSGQLQEGMKLELIVAERQVDEAVTIILQHALPESEELNAHVILLDVTQILQIPHPP